MGVLQLGPPRHWNNSVYLQGRQYQLESEFLFLPTQDHHSSLNPVARVKKIVRCTFEAAQCYAPTVISPVDLILQRPKVVIIHPLAQLTEPDKFAQPSLPHF